MKSVSKTLICGFGYFIGALMAIAALPQLLPAQVSEGGVPYSFLNHLPANIHTVTMGFVDVPTLLAEDVDEAQQEIPPPFRFGFPFEVDLGLNNAGTWRELANGDRLWRLRIVSPGAFSINLLYDEFWLPEGAQFFIYNASGSVLIGAFTAANNKAHGKFSTEPVAGNVIILEYYEPVSVQEPGRLHISRVVHAYRNLFGVRGPGGVVEENFGDAAQCNKNVNCPEGQPWCKEKRAAVMILLSGGTRLCSGGIVNNTSQDLTPYLLTAHHCIDRNPNDGNISESEESDAEQWMIMFNYESPSCSDVDGPTNQTVSGTSLIASYDPTDFALLVLSSSPPASYKVHYAGWSRSSTPATSVALIHHPAGDIKKISLDSDSPWTFGKFWWVRDWDVGTTESGSSGAPLFDQNHRVVGQHRGSTTHPACDPNKGAFSGKVSVSWEGGGTDLTRLKDWLDPVPTGVTTLDGITIPNPPTNLYVSGYEGGMPTINWTAPTCADIDYYELWWRESDGNPPQGWTLLATTTATSWVDSRVTIETSNPEDTYHYKALTVNQEGRKSGFSNEDEVNVKECPPWLCKQLAGELEAIPEAYALYENYPNPFNPITSMKYNLPEWSFVELRIYDLMGREIRILVNGNEEAGYKSVIWDGKDSHGSAVSSGMYLYRLDVISYESNKEFHQTRKMVLLR